MIIEQNKPLREQTREWLDRHSRGSILICHKVQAAKVLTDLIRMVEESDGNAETMYNISEDQIVELEDEIERLRDGIMMAHDLMCVVSAKDNTEKCRQLLSNTLKGVER